MKQSEMKISLARMYYPVKVLGPGDRFGIWVNGCARNCDGCISPELRRYDPSKEVSTDRIMQMIRRVDGRIDGFTISGGEPFYKPEALCNLVEALVPVSDDILIYTGYRIEELKARKNRAIDAVLDRCAALIDGPYIARMNQGVGWMGSSNQRCWVFKYPDKYALAATAKRGLQTVLYGRQVLLIGIPEGRGLS